MLKLSQLTYTRGAWLALAGSSFALLAAALYFQYGMGLEPCVRCIYQRTAVLAIGLLALCIAIRPQQRLWAWIGLLGWLGIASWGYLIAAEHVALQQSANSWFAVCDIAPRFPSWLPLHEWLPSFFAAPGMCGDIDWQFAGLSMPQWLQVIFACYALLALLVISSSAYSLRRG